jgi:SAM-dependent methyltransferase
VDGIEVHAPDLAHSAGGFHADYFPELFRIEATSFWFRARNQVIMYALRRYAKNFRSLLEIGCGTGFVLSGVAHEFPEAKLTGGEIFIDGLSFAFQRLPMCRFMQMDARCIPFVEEFDVIGAFDVLEHIKEDEEVIEQIHDALRPNGIMIITVPQHAWLWSTTDEHAFHERRYSASEIEGKTRAAGFDILRSTSFVSLLLPAMAFSRIRRKRNEKNMDSTSELNITKTLNALFYRIMKIELFGIKLGLNYPVGGSRLIVAQKT